MSTKPTPLPDGSYPGEIRTFAGETPPDGWLECNGDEYPDATYPKLSAVIGDLWGSSQPNHFRIPDLRGLFVRGWNHGKQDDPADPADPDVAKRNLRSGAPGAPNGPKDHVGTWQGDQIGAHGHTISLTGRWGDKSGGPFGWGADNGELPAQEKGTSGAGGNESRPRNAYVMFCIRHD